MKSLHIIRIPGIFATLALAFTACSRDDHDHDHPHGEGGHTHADGDHDHADGDHVHAAVELGPNGGRLVEFDGGADRHAELLVNDSGLLEVALLDADLKPIDPAGQTLSVITGNRSGFKPVPVSAENGKFVTAEPIAEDSPEQVTIQLAAADGADPATARLTLDRSICPECDKPEYICTCGNEE